MFLGYVYEQHNNPADFFLNMITANENSVKNGKLVTTYLCIISITCMISIVQIHQ